MIFWRGQRTTDTGTRGVLRGPRGPKKEREKKRVQLSDIFARHYSQSPSDVSANWGGRIVLWDLLVTLKILQMS